MLTRQDIGQLLSDQMTAFASRKEAQIEPEFLDDADADIRLGLARWHDRDFPNSPGFGPIWRNR